MDLEFKSKVLDNVHGFIHYTKAEERLIHLLLFQRLQSIKQLSLVNWVFPGSEHTRYIHSLGVMHIADRMANHLKLSYEQRKIVRMAGLLHDIGHYPLSHVCEYPYKERMECFRSDKYCHEVNIKAKEDIDNLSAKPEVEFMKAAKQGHHEDIGSEIIRNNNDIKKIITDECGAGAVETICDMITGNVSRAETDPLLVQILHSELDADGIDYLLRDATFSGTSFGSFELEQLLSSMTIAKYNGQNMLCITSKGIAAADQYLINKFFSYSQVVFNKHTSILEWMAKQLAAWMQENSVYLPRKNILIRDWIRGAGDYTDYLSFTDNFFWSALKGIVGDPAKNVLPKYILDLCLRLLTHQELEYVDKSEVRIISDDYEKILETLKKSFVYKKMTEWNTRIAVLSTRSITDHIPYEKYLAALHTDDEEGADADIDSKDRYRMDMNTKRLMQGICVADDDGTLHLLCDDQQSLMQQLYGVRLVILRAYDFPPCD